ncbi:MAG: helix-turn-helix domain-containing protein [Thermonemataceae bacterium]
MIPIGERIRKHREQRNYSQEYVAEYLGISQNAYSKIEINQTKSFTLERLIKLAELFEVDLGELLGIEKSVNIYSNSDNAQHQHINTQSSYTSPEMVALLEKELAKLHEENAKLLEIINNLTSK